MTAVDWKSCELLHQFSVEMVDPLDRDMVLGVLPIKTTGSVTWDDDSDTRVSASIDVPDWSQWIENSWLRVVHEIDGTDYRSVLGTFLVWDEGARWAINRQEASPQLVSCLKALEVDRLTGPLFVGIGATAKAALMSVFDATGHRYAFAPDCKDYRMSAVRAYDAGETRLSVAQELALLAGDELVAGDDGRVVVRAYTEPALRSPSFTLDAEAGGLVHAASVSRSSDSRQRPSRSIVTWAGDEEAGVGAVSGFWDLGGGHPASAARRGYTVAEVHELGDMPGPRTSAQAQAIARSYLPDDSAPVTEWQVETVIVPVRGGDVVSFRPPGSEFRNCRAKNVRLKFAGAMTMALQEV